METRQQRYEGKPYSRDIVPLTAATHTVTARPIAKPPSYPRRLFKMQQISTFKHSDCAISITPILCMLIVLSLIGMGATTAQYSYGPWKWGYTTMPYPSRGMAAGSWNGTITLIGGQGV